MIDYNAILRSDRFRPSTRTGRDILIESESDRGRVIFSPAFRRLQQKAQVFSMEPNAAVRSRLTHSLEVSQLGRYLAGEIGKGLVDKRKIDAYQQGALINFVETACLMHDIGNPPFGHFGEVAIQSWFKKNGEDCLQKSVFPNSDVNDRSVLIKTALADFNEFDGNPQGLRIVARLQWNTDEYGLNLTKTTLGTFLKYLRSPGEECAGKNFAKKPGFFITEKDIVRDVWQVFGYEVPQRFPLAYIMEAADDIAYCISDLEDSFEKKIIYEKVALPCIKREYEKKSKSLKSIEGEESIRQILVNLCDGGVNGREFTYTDFRTSLSTILVQYAAKRFLNMQGEVSKGYLQSLLPEDEPPGYMLKVLKNFCREHVYKHESIQRVEVAGYNAISGLFDQFKPLLMATHEQFQVMLGDGDKSVGGDNFFMESKLLRLFPKKYLQVYSNCVEKKKNESDWKIMEWNARAHLVVDFVSGMTDDFAMKTYRTLAGIDI